MRAPPADTPSNPADQLPTRVVMDRLVMGDAVRHTGEAPAHGPLGDAARAGSRGFAGVPGFVRDRITDPRSSDKNSDQS